MADKISEIYNKALAKGVLKQGMTEEQFREKTSTEEGLKSFYDYATNHGMRFHEFNEFKTRFYGGSQDESAQETETQVTEAPKENTPVSFWQSVASHNPYPMSAAEVQKSEDEKNKRREDNAHLLYSPEDFAQVAAPARFNIEAKDTYGFVKDENGIPTFGKISAQQPEAKQEEIKVPFKQEETYVNRQEKTMDDVLRNVVESWTANSEEGKQARAIYEDDVNGAVQHYMEKLDEYQQTLQDKVRRGEVSLEDANKQFDAKRNEYIAKIKETEDKGYNDFVAQASAANKDYINRRYREFGNEIVGERLSEDIPKVQSELDRYIRYENSRKKFAPMSGPNVAGVGQPMYEPKYTKEIRMLKEADEILKDAKQLRDAALSGKGLTGGFADKIGDKDTWDFGIGEAMRSVDLKRIVDKLESGTKREELSQEEQTLLDAYSTYLQAMAYNSHKLSTWYKAGTTTAESLPFMLQIAATSALGAGSSLAKTVFSAGFKTGQSALTRAALKGAAIATSAVVESAIQTALFNIPKIVAGAAERQMGEVQVGLDDKNRRFTYEGIKEGSQQGGLESVLNATWDTYVENLSERILEAANPFGRLIGARGSMASMFAEIGANKWVSSIMRFADAPVIRSIKRNVHWGGYLQEVMEEEVGGIMRLLCSDVNTLKEAGLDRDSQIDILTGLLPTSVAFGLVGGGNVVLKYSKNVADYRSVKKMLSSEAEKELFESLFKESRVGEFGQKAHQMIRDIVSSDKYTPEQKMHCLEAIVGKYYNVISDELKEKTRALAEERYGAEIDQKIASMKNNQTGVIYETVDKEVRPVVITDGEVVTIMIDENGKEVKSDGIVVLNQEKTQPKLGVRYVKPDGTIEEQPHEVSRFDLPFAVLEQKPEELREKHMIAYISGMTGQATYEYEGKTYDVMTGKEVEKPKEHPAEQQQQGESEAAAPVEQNKNVLSTGIKPIEKTIQVKTSDGKTVDVPIKFSSNAYTIEEDGSISAKNFTIQIGGSGKNSGTTVTGNTKKEYFEALNNLYRAEMRKAAEAEAKRLEEEEYKKTESYRIEQARLEAQQKYEAQKEDMRKSIPMRKNGTLDTTNATPEQIFFYNMEKYGETEAILRAANQIVWDMQHIEELQAKKGLMPQDRDAQIDESQDRIDGYYAAINNWIGPEAVDSAKAVVNRLLNGEEQTTTQEQMTEQQPQQPVVNEQPKQEEQKTEPKKEKKEPKAEKKEEPQGEKLTARSDEIYDYIKVETTEQNGMQFHTYIPYAKTEEGQEAKPVEGAGKFINRKLIIGGAAKEFIDANKDNIRDIQVTLVSEGGETINSEVIIETKDGKINTMPAVLSEVPKVGASKREKKESLLAPPNPPVAKKRKAPKQVTLSVNPFSEDVALVKEANGKVNFVPRAEIKENQTEVPKRVVYALEGGIPVPYIIRSAKESFGLNSAVSVVGEDGVVRSISANQLFSDTERTPFVEENKKLKVTNLKQVVDLPVYTDRNKKVYTLADLLEVHSTESGEISGYEYVKQIVEAENPEDKEALARFNGNIKMVVNSWNLLAKTLLNEKGYNAKKLLAYRYMRYNSARSAAYRRDKLSVEDRIKQARSYDRMMDGSVSFDVGNYSNENLAGRGLNNPLYRIACMIEICRDMEGVKGVTFDVELPEDIANGLEKNIITPKEIEKYREEYKALNAKKNKSSEELGRMEAIKVEYPEVNTTWVPLTREVGEKGYEDVKNLYKIESGEKKVNRARSKEQQELDDFDELCMKAVDAFKEGDDETFNALSEQIGQKVQEHAGDKVNKFANRKMKYQNTVSALLTKVFPQVAKIARLHQHYDRALATTNEEPVRRQQAVDDLKKKIEDVVYQLRMLSDAESNDKTREKLGAQRKSLEEDLAKAEARLKEPLRTNVTELADKLNAAIAANPKAEEQYQEMIKADVPTNGLKVEFATAETAPEQSSNPLARVAFRAVQMALAKAKGINLHYVGSQEEAIELLQGLVGLPEYHIVGEQGARNVGSEAVQKHTMGMLLLAMNMSARGYSAQEIRERTFWEKGVDGKWRYEIPDMKLDEQKVNQIKRAIELGFYKEYYVSIDDIISKEGADNIFKSLYKDASVKQPNIIFYYEEGDTHGYAESPRYEDGKLVEAGDIHINLFHYNNIVRLNMTFVHECQHIIQHYEGFAIGGSAGTANTWLNDMALIRIQANNRILPAQNKHEFLAHVVSSNGAPDVYDTAKSIGRNFPILWASIAYLKHEGEISSEKAGELRDYLQEQEDAYNKIKERFISSSGLDYSTASENLIGSMVYRMLAGEVEARNAEKRTKLPENVRIEKTLESTEDEKREDQIVIIDGVNVALRFSRPEFFKSPNGTILGWAVGNDIYLTDEGLNSETAIHEYTHLWVKSLRASNPTAWKKIVGLCKKQSALWKKIKSEENYKDLDDDSIASELLSRYSGKRGYERLLAEAKQVADESGLKSDKLAESLVKRMQNVLREFWEQVKEFFGWTDVSIDDIADKVLKDLFDGKPLNLSSAETEQEMEDIKQKAIADGTFMKAPNGEQSLLSEKQWLQVRTKAFKAWYGDWQNPKEGEFFLLDENGEPMIVYHGTTVAGFDIMDPKDEMRDENGEIVERSNGRGIFMTPQQWVAGAYADVVGLDVDNAEALIGDAPHSGIYSLYANIKNPLIIDCSDHEGNPSRYWNIPFGIYKISGPNMDTLYFDSYAEAEQWMDDNGFGIFEDADELGEPTIIPVVYSTDEFVDLARKRGYDGVIFKNIIDGSDSKILAGDSQFMTPHEVIVALVPEQVKSATQNKGLFSMADARIEYQVVDSKLTELDEPTEKRIRREENEIPAGMLNPDLSEQERMTLWEERMTKALDQTNGLRLMQNSINAYRKENGLEPIPADQDVRTKFEACRSVIANKVRFLTYGIEMDLDNTIRELANKVENSAFYRKYMQEVGGESPAVLTPVQIIERYLMARNNWERSKEGVARGLAEFKNRMGYIDKEGNIQHVGVIEFAKEFVDAFGEPTVNNLWAKVRAMTDFALDTNLEGGLISREEYERLKAKKYYIPQRGFWDDVNPENEQDDVLLDRKRRGNIIARHKLDSMHKASGGKSLAEGCLAYIYRDARQAITLSEQNKVNQALFYLLRDNAAWCHLPEHMFKVPRQVWYEERVNAEGNVEIVPMNDGPTEEQRKEMANLKAIVKELKEQWLKAETDEARNDIEDEIAATEAQYPYFDEKDSYRILHSRAKTNKALVGVRINGVPCEIELTPRFLLTADALNGRRDKRLDIPAIKTVTSWLSAQFTINNPTFFAVNIVRDTPLILQKGAAEYGFEFSARFTVNWSISNKAVWKYILSNEIDNTDIGAQLRDFLMNGGNTGYSNLEELERFRRRVADLNRGGINKEIDRWRNVKNLNEALKMAGRALNPLDKAIGWAELRPVAQALNEWSELISRFAAYKSVVDMGLGINEGIKAAHNLSTNFNRRGLGDPFMNLFNSMSVFVNAGLQGATGYWRAFDSQGDAKEKAKKIARTIMYMGVAPAFLGFLDTLFNPDSDDDEIVISEYDRENYIILSNRRIALNEQLKPFWVMGVNIALMLRGRRTPKEAVNSIMNSMLTNLLPIPQNVITVLTGLVDNWMGKEEYSFGELARNAIMPSFMQTINQIADNKNFMGGKLRYDIGDIPEYDMAPNEARLLQDIAYGFYLWGGGNSLVASKTTKDGERMSKFFDVNPKQIRNYLFMIPSGALDNFCFAWGIFRNMQEGTIDNVRVKDIPVVNRFYRVNDSSLYRYGVMREARALTKDYNDKVNNYKKQLIRAYDTGDSAAAVEAQRLLTEAMSDETTVRLDKLVKMYDKISIRSLQNKLGESRKELEKNHAETVKQLDAQEKELIQMILEGVNLKKGLKPDENNQEWIDWFDNHSARNNYGLW